MAEKNFKQMSTKKLNALLETASEEDKVLIQEVLDTRAAANLGAGSPALSEEEQAAIAAAENETGVNKPEEKKAAAPKKEKMTDEEREALANKLRAEAVNHKCRVVPFNSIEWVDGVVVSIIEEKRSNKVLFAVKIDDGRRLVKAHCSNLIEILDEVVERAKRTRGSHTPKLDADGNPIEADNTPWTDEEIEEAVKEVIDNVGKTVKFPEAGAYGQVAENAAILTGRIISLVPAKRTKTILYRIEIDQPDAEEGAPKKYAHKVSTLDSLEIAEELDEIGTAINAKFRARRYNEPSSTKEKMNKKQRFDYATNNLAKAKAALEKQQALVEKREKELEAARIAYEEAVANGETFPEAEPEAETEEGAKAADNSEDLM